ncbi:hypothetical protein F4808DRAFT_273841 [Astrocystis sublimbata]|nr:hypothetical protein F4808DRAFT_273841 [Astrocystis sublimbata]
MSEDEQVARPSRYRSLRQTISAPSPDNNPRTTNGNHTPDQRHGNSIASSLSRSMSRYRRRAASVTADMDNHAAAKSGLDNAPPVPAIPLSIKRAWTAGPNEDTVKSAAQFRRTEAQQRNARPATDDRDTSPRGAYGSNRGQPVMPKQSMQNGPPPPPPLDVSSEEERKRLLEEQKKKDLQRLEAELESCQRVKTQVHKVRSPVVEKFVALAMGSKGSKDGLLSPAPPITTSARSNTRARSQEPANPLLARIEPGGRGVVPQTDAPTSAINAGDRNVAVRYRHHTFSLHVTPETTPIDLIAQMSSETAYNQEIDPERCLVLEQYGMLGLERRLRRYERVRDILNSWDNDAQNQLAMVIPDSRESHDDLHVGAVADYNQPPPGCQFYMYHSNRPGKWDKRWITLLESGQIVCAKKPNAKTTDKNTVGLCHLSDYDIYTPTESQIRRRIKPPKRYCFAIKSQHKTTLFLNTDNFVQYFSTEDPKAARKFKQRAHIWRSWYLVDRFPEARKKQTGSGLDSKVDTSLGFPPTRNTSTRVDDIAVGDGQRPHVPADTPREPHRDAKRSNKRLSLSGTDIPTQQPNSPPRNADDQRIRRRLSKRENPDNNYHQAFARESEEGFTGGLLGDEYDSRKQALTTTDTRRRPQEPAFTEGPSLLNGRQGPEPAADNTEPPSWFPSAREHTTKQRPDETTVSRPPISGSAPIKRRLSLNAGTSRPNGLASPAIRPSTQHNSQFPDSRTHMQSQPNSPALQPTGLPNFDRNGPPTPLVDLTPKFQEAPQWSKEGKGHGVKPPEGIAHLVDFISAGNGTDPLSNRNIIRRPTTSGTGSQGRTRSMSAATSAGRPLFDDAPAMPALPSRLANAPVQRRGSVRNKEDEQERARQRNREREYRERAAAYNAVPGRTGTLKVV